MAPHIDTAESLAGSDPVHTRPCLDMRLETPPRDAARCASDRLRLPPTLSITRNIRLAVGLVATGSLVALLVICVEAWTVRDRYRGLSANSEMGADAVALAVATAAYGQGVLEYLDTPDAGRQARLNETGKDLAERLGALTGLANTDDERRWGSEVRAIHDRFTAQGGAIVSAHDLIRASQARIERHLQDAERTVASRPRVSSRSRTFAWPWPRTYGAVTTLSASCSRGHTRRSKQPSRLRRRDPRSGSSTRQPARRRRSFATSMRSKAERPAS